MGKARSCLSSLFVLIVCAMGIAGCMDYRLVSTFCFTFPATPGAAMPNGPMHLQTIVSEGGHRCPVVNRSELKLGLPCEEVVRRAKIIEPISGRTSDMVAYHLILDVVPSMSMQPVAAVIARCGQSISAGYIIDFTNPGGYIARR